MPRSIDYRTLAEFRYQIRKFLHFSETAAREEGLNEQQHQLLLALRGLPDDREPTVGTLAERLQLRHHSAVELIDRLEERGLVARAADPSDGRRTLVSITAGGNALLDKLTRLHRTELHTAGPLLLDALRRLLA
jgi:DNA-binding MarR family transcriptional regulator